ncbi:serine/threonine protein kinase Pkn9 [Plesiocystis pacifica SIR-1]|uniref:Serine/threonine protein kinase Pkn9 n=1 Tax=Plesiocystis pacifica SIR-1 TaxID=391625 RepID=A6G0A2_9BACT|nr:FHA domain-containing serine/threonine-protein kinase [Plesiocystis pacifica]EDM80799.1 serine/threonine protein kinase Pkn9 [Plesiocystis pacifica SIR-1]
MVDCPHKRIRPLGEGAVGDVHLCVDVFERRLVVVKWLRAEVHEDSEAAIRFTREADLMLGMTAEGLIRVETWNVDDYGRTWMAMEFVDGLVPSAVIRPGEGWSVHRLIDGVGRTLDELHGEGVLHRDLKPDNVLLRNRPDGWEPVIIDLGIAKWLSEEAATTTGSVFGTPHYMSPEQFRDTKHVGPATDRYALAVVCYELLCGRPPFDGRSLPDLLQQHMNSPVPPLRVPRATDAHEDGSTLHGSEQEYRAAPALDRFMRRAMAKDPGARFTSSAEQSQAFQQAAMADGMWVPPRQPAPLFSPLDLPKLELSSSRDELCSVFDMRQGPVVLGRHEACQFQVTSRRLSRLHACIYSHRGQLWIADLHSQNGTVYQGRSMTPGVPAPLPSDGSEAAIRLYDREIRIRCVA